MRSVRKWLVHVGVFVLVSSCSQVEPGGGLKKQTGEEEAVEEEDQEEEKSEPSNTKLATYDSFKITAYPILEKNCGSCHGSTAAPKFAVEEDSVSSHDALVDAGKVDFNDPSQSRIVLRLTTDQHNCWGDCEANGAEIEKAVKTWALSRVEDSDPKTITGIKTSEIALSKITKIKTANPIDIGMIAFEAESGMLAGNFITASDSDASDASLVTSETDGGVVAGDLAAAHADTSNLGSITFNIVAAEDGFYKMYAFARRATGNPNNDFFVKIDDGDMVTWNIGSDTNANEFRTNEEPGTEQFLEWEKGEHTITFYQAMLGASLDKVMITKNIVPDFTKVEVNPQNFDSLTFDLSGILEVKSSFSINLIKVGEGSYQAQNPTLYNPTNANIKIRGIYPLISGEYKEQNALYKDVDILTNNAFEVLSEGSSIFLLGKGEEGEDPLLSISFDVLEISDETPAEE